MEVSGADCHSTTDSGPVVSRVGLRCVPAGPVIFDRFGPGTICSEKSAGAALLQDSSSVSSTRGPYNPSY